MIVTKVVKRMCDKNSFTALKKIYKNLLNPTLRRLSVFLGVIAGGTVCYNALAKSRLGIIITPGISLPRAQSIRQTTKSSMQFSAGGHYHWHIKDHHYLTTGLQYATHSFRLPSKDTSPDKKTYTYYTDELQIPCLLRLSSGEILLDTRIYVSTGFLFGLRLTESMDPIETNNPKRLFTRPSVYFLLSSGLEYEFATSTRLYAGLSYQFGIFNMADTTLQNEHCVSSLKNNAFQFNIGLIF